MGTFRVVLTDQVFPDTTIERAIIEAAGGSLEVASGSREEVLRAAEDADALLTTYFALAREDLARLRHCRIVARYGIGVDNVDVAAALERGIAVTNVPDYCIEEVAAHALALTLALLRRVPQGHAEVLAGRWRVDPLRPLRRPSSLTLGLVGYGRIARRVAEGARALGLNIVVHDPYLSADPPGARRLGSLEALLEASDVVSVHCPLTPETRGLIGPAELARMRPGAVLVNTSRGPLVQLPAVIQALREGRLAGAGLDVTDPEPPDPTLLRDVPGLLVTPHVAYYSEEALAESQRKAATQVVKAMTGQPLDYPVRPS
ncbi:C-terminal binding protein [Aciditerrimonas ferrireducens]|uniref:C-terminal binding protein n=1 Tax=Aciditerrimonas ferrireducens TaxID=667306 RepID=A0ABV6C0K1_9ACTN